MALLYKYNGTYRIDKKGCFCDLIPTIPKKNVSFRDILDEIDTAIRNEFPEVTQGALNNCHGDWYEWLIGITAWNYIQIHPTSNFLCLLPTISQFDCARLYSDDLYNKVIDLREKVQKATEVQLITSNPDFVIIDKNHVEIGAPWGPGVIEKTTPEIIEFIQEAFRAFQGKCNFYGIKGYLSSKTSFRPDRRLQIPHEGSLMKAIYAHLQTREWIINPPGLKYFATAMQVNDPDRNALKTVATHSITNVSSIPQSAVDEVFTIDSVNSANMAFKQILA